MPLLGGKDEIREYQERYKYFYIILVIFLSVISLRLWYLQIYKGTQFKLYAEQNRIWQEKDRAPRGMIFDRNGKLLVDNRLSFDIIIRPQYLLDKENTIQKLSSMLEISEKNIKLELAKAKSKNLPLFYPVVISEDVDRDKVALVESNKLFMQGVDVLTRNKRTYLYGESMAHVIGYIGEVSRDEIRNHNSEYVKYDKKLFMGDYIGKFGLENVWDKELRGKDGAQYVVVDANGRRRNSEENEALFGNLPISDYVPGNNLVLTIDSDLQEVAYRHFHEEGKKGAVIALDPNNGEVLVMLSSPSFDPTVLSKGISSIMMSEMKNNPYRPFYNKTIQDHYSPGSTFKPLVALAALEEGLIDPGFQTTCRGSLRFGRRKYHCHSKWGHGTIDLRKGIVRSCDIVFYKLGMKLGVDKIYDYSVKLGLSSPTGINLPNETTGLMPNSEWKYNRFGERWIPGENLAVAIGQSYTLVTPIQLANMYAGIATKKIFKPILVKKIEKYDGTEIGKIDPEMIHEIDIKDQNRDFIMKALWGVVNEREGTAWWYRYKGLDMAGKTGTVQLFRIASDKIYQKCEEMDERMRHHGWFVGLAPYKHPQIVVAVIAEHSCHGSSGAAPIVRDIIKAYYDKYGFPSPKKDSQG
ncbi:MAG: penicillin-binding protein 2 [Oligoflexia bacterium]|nr:penicillin-binding protein 2 [Oligoflexia bacterium]